MAESGANETTASKRPSGLIKNKWVASIVSLVVGLGLGTGLGREVLDTAGIPASCVRALQRADTAVSTGQAIGDRGKAALEAVKALHIGEAGDLLGQAKDEAFRLVRQAKKFNVSRKSCDADRK